MKSYTITNVLVLLSSIGVIGGLAVLGSYKEKIDSLEAQAAHIQTQLHDHSEAINILKTESKDVINRLDRIENKIDKLYFHQ